MLTSPQRASACFDPTLVCGHTRQIPLVQVIDPLHRGHRPDLVEQYRAAMAQGERFPPVAVLALGPYYLLADGHKRFSAYRTLGYPEIVVEVWTLTRWAQDQWQQLQAKSSQQWQILRRLPYDASAWRDAQGLLHDTLRHWWRVVCSLLLMGRR